LLPHYLIPKLQKLNITSLEELRDIPPIKLFQWLKYTHTSLSYQTLFTLYSLTALNSQFPDIITQTELIKAYNTAVPSYPPLPIETLNYFLQKAVIEGGRAQAVNEIPVGAIVVYSNNKLAQHFDEFTVIGSGYNLTLESQDICAHAEIRALQNAAQYLNNHRLTTCDLYVTLEPCLMCIGAILHSRIRRVIFGAVQPKTGAIFSQYNVLNNRQVNHQTEAIGPINNTLYQKQLQNFMQKKH
jgi:tRNA(adenine34) deaminase